MEKKTSKKANTKAKKGVKEVKKLSENEMKELDKIVDKIKTSVGKELKTNETINNNQTTTLDEINLDDISTTGVVSIPTEISTISYNNAISTDIIQNKIAELKEQKAKATGTLRIYTAQDGYNFQIQVLEELLKEVK